MTTTEIDTLSNSEVREFENHEATIERGRKTFVEVGNALMAIRDKKLYRTTYGTFENYCQERWSFGREYAHRLIAGAKAVNDLLPIGNTENSAKQLPATESQARALSAVPSEKRQEVWNEAVETAPNGNVTAAHVTATAERRNGAATPPPPAPASHAAPPPSQRPAPPPPRQEPPPPPVTMGDAASPPALACPYCDEEPCSCTPGAVEEPPAPVTTAAAAPPSPAFVGKAVLLACTPHQQALRNLEEARELLADVGDKNLRYHLNRAVAFVTKLVENEK